MQCSISHVGSQTAVTHLLALLAFRVWHIHLTDSSGKDRSRHGDGGNGRKQRYKMPRKVISKVGLSNKAVSEAFVECLSWKDG